MTPVRLMLSKNVSSCLVRSIRARSVFAAVARAASSQERERQAFLQNSHTCSRVCSCALHQYTKADNNLMTFLDGEIKFEKEGAEAVPSLKHFQSSVNGTLVSLEREHNGERIIVSFDLNQNVNQDEGFASDDEDDSHEESEGKIISYPAFTVEVIKDSNQTLKFQCECNFDVGESQEGENEEGDATELFQFINVTVMDRPDADQHTSVYSAETENMDSDLYSYLSSMLSERGIDNKFLRSLLQFSTTLEHHHYITFLEKLRSFVKEK